MNWAATQVLRTGTIDELTADVSVPTYDRARIRTGIVHFGVGGFHRIGHEPGRGSDRRRRSGRE